MGTTRIEWTDETWNVTGGCTPVSAGCANCAAARSARRCIGFGNDKYKGLVDGSKWTGEIRLYPDELKKPLHWRQPRRVFVDFMSDLFHPDVPFEFIEKVWAVMALCPDHTFQVLTKRPERMAEYLTKSDSDELTAEDRVEANLMDGGYPKMAWPLPNVWLGTTAENQEMAYKRTPHLLKCPAAKRFVSVEPMLGAVNIIIARGMKNTTKLKENDINWVTLDWVICGGESGPGARPMHPDWARSIRDQCKAAGVPFFFKQWGKYGDAGGGVRSTDVCISHDGHFEVAGKNYVCVGNESEGEWRRPLGKKKAGSLLDGKQHKEMPK